MAEADGGYRPLAAAPATDLNAMVMRNQAKKMRGALVQLGPVQLLVCAVRWHRPRVPYEVTLTRHSRQTAQASEREARPRTAIHSYWRPLRTVIEYIDNIQSHGRRPTSSNPSLPNTFWANFLLLSKIFSNSLEYRW